MESVRSQTYEDIEHIIVDGASVDGTRDLIKEYADKG
ncbi:MAG: glycosyltransferase, partial [Candidatus Moranbacteria bacterium]|nr:glycosyltransferase [Candidatus Moranbacteria bacterium]